MFDSIDMRTRRKKKKKKRALKNKKIKTCANGFAIARTTTNNNKIRAKEPKINQVKSALQFYRYK